VSTTPKRRRLGAIVGGLTLVAAAVLGGHAVLSDDAGDGDAAAGRTATPTIASPAISTDGSIAPATADPTDVATDPPSTVTAPPPPASTPRTVDVVQTWVAWDTASGVSAGGYVAQTVEQGGTCTLTLTRDGTELTARAPGAPNVSNVACGGLTVPADRLTPGRWTSVLTYSSATSTGTSPAMEVEVP
jgi:hypothetical protein